VWKLIVADRSRRTGNAMSRARSVDSVQVSRSTRASPRIVGRGDWIYVRSLGRRLEFVVSGRATCSQRFEEFTIMVTSVIFGRGSGALPWPAGRPHFLQDRVFAPKPVRRPRVLRRLTTRLSLYNIAGTEWPDESKRSATLR